MDFYLCHLSTPLPNSPNPTSSADLAPDRGVLTKSDLKDYCSVSRLRLLCCQDFSFVTWIQLGFEESAAVYACYFSAKVEPNSQSDQGFLANDLETFVLPMGVH